MHLHVYTQFNEDRNVEIYKYVRVNFEHDELIDYMRITLEDHRLFGSNEYPYSRLNHLTVKKSPTSNELHTQFTKFKDIQRQSLEH